jgi:type IV secretory pathway ATPase VirB11/archaellum biosynthesis ATPase
MKNHIVSNSLINELIQDDTVEEIWINGPGHIFVARNGIAELTSVVLSENEIIVLVEQLLRNTGRRLDISHPFVDATLPDGSRLHAVIPDITKKWPAINIRKFGSATPKIDFLVEKRMLNSQIATLLKEIVGKSKNILKLLEISKNYDVKTISFLGNDGGKANDISDFSIIIPSSDTARIQECHVLLGHSIIEVIENKLFKK